MEDIATKAKLVSGHKWSQLKNMLDNQNYEPQPQVYAVKTVSVPDTPRVVLSETPRTQHFISTNVSRQLWNGSSIFILLRILIEVVFLEQPRP